MQNHWLIGWRRMIFSKYPLRYSLMPRLIFSFLFLCFCRRWHMETIKCGGSNDGDATNIHRTSHHWCVWCVLCARVQRRQQQIWSHGIFYESQRQPVTLWHWMVFESQMNHWQLWRRNTKTNSGKYKTIHRNYRKFLMQFVSVCWMWWAWRMDSISDSKVFYHKQFWWNSWRFYPFCASSR